MKIIVAVVVHDRISNIELWVKSWKLCSKEGAELIVIHNYKNEADIEAYKAVCEGGGVKYIPRKNIGMDIGAFQDVCRGRLEGFPNAWDYLFWATDDVIPMSKKFIHHYITAIKNPSVGVVCLEISREVKTHIRTTGFMLSQETASKIVFPSPTITTRAECYEFEHKGKNAFYEQIRKMGKAVVQIHPDLKKSYLWDSHIRAHLRRKGEHHNEFSK